MLTVIIDYDSGNLHSAEKAFQRMAAETNAGDVIVSTKPEDVSRADRLVLPGDGAFPACRQQLSDHRGIYEALEEAVITQGRPSWHMRGYANASHRQPRVSGHRRL